jgi:hypothetical protein
MRPLSIPFRSDTLLTVTIATLIFRSVPARAYIPAVPVNDTSGLNLTDSSTISISWQSPPGVYSGAVYVNQIQPGPDLLQCCEKPASVTDMPKVVSASCGCPYRGNDVWRAGTLRRIYNGRKPHDDDAVDSVYQL